MKTYWRLFVAVSCLFVLWLSLTATADVYNFYLSKQPKGANGAQSVDTDEEEATPTPAPVTQQRIEPDSHHPPPIVINNINTNTNTAAPPAPTLPSQPAVAPSATPVVPTAASQSVATVALPVDNSSRWKLGLVAAVYLPHEPAGTYAENLSVGNSVGGLLSLGYGVSRSFNLSLYAGLTGSPASWNGDNKIAGIDAEFMPFRIPLNESTDLLQVGVLAGGSTAGAVNGNWGSLHVGARADLNFGQKFGITAATRLNFGYIMFETGLVAHL